MVSHMNQSFWTHCRVEVLQQLQQRNKWLQPQTNVQKDDVVLLMDKNSPPSRWPLGHMIEVYPGKGGLIRVATIKTSSTTLTRLIVKLIRLPHDADAEEYYNNCARVIDLYA